jgi:hypothetical protein
LAVSKAQSFFAIGIMHIQFNNSAMHSTVESTLLSLQPAIHLMNHAYSPARKKISQ